MATCRDDSAIFVAAFGGYRIDLDVHTDIAGFALVVLEATLGAAFGPVMASSRRELAEGAAPKQLLESAGHALGEWVVTCHRGRWGFGTITETWAELRTALGQHY